MLRGKFGAADVAQQVVGGFLVAGPFVVTEEVWDLAGRMTVAHAAATVAIVLAIGYGSLYEADEGRDPDRESELGGVPTRFLSLMVVSYGAVALLALVFAAPRTFGADVPTTVKAVGIGAIFSVVGASTADSLF